MKIAVIGSGIAGLSAAWLLAQKHDVTLLEKQPSAGLGAFNLDCETEAGTVRIDVPLRAFNPGHYRNLVPFYRHLGVELLSTDHSAAYTHSGEDSPFFSYRYLDLAGFTLPRPGRLQDISWHNARIAGSLARLLLQSRLDLNSGYCDRLTWQEYVERRGFNADLCQNILRPSFAAIGTCSYEAIDLYPARDILEFLGSGLLFDGIWRVRQGVEQAIQRLLAPVSELRCGRGVRRLAASPSGKIRVFERGGWNRVFDHVVLATQANQAADLLEPMDGESVRVAQLRSVRYERSEVVVHRDTGLAPGFGRGQSPVLFEISPEHPAPMASIHLNALYPELAGSDPVFQTWYPLREPKSGSVVGRAHFERPLVSLESREALQQMRQDQHTGRSRISVVGSYVGEGIPLLESALYSSMEVAQALGINSPWPTTLR